MLPRIRYARMRLRARISDSFEPWIWRLKLDAERRQRDTYNEQRSIETYTFMWQGTAEQLAKLKRRRLWALRRDTFWSRISFALGNETFPVFGRLEGEHSPTKTAWLDDHSDYASSTTGDTEWLGFYQLFVSLPWNVNGAAILCTTSPGFRTMTEYTNEADAQRDFGEIERDFDADNEGAGLDDELGDDEIGDEDPFIAASDDENPTYGPSFFTRDEIRAANTLEDA